MTNPLSTSVRGADVAGPSVKTPRPGAIGLAARIAAICRLVVANEEVLQGCGRLIGVAGAPYLPGHGALEALGCRPVLFYFASL